MWPTAQRWRLNPGYRLRVTAAAAVMVTATEDCQQQQLPLQGAHVTRLSRHLSMDIRPQILLL